MKHAYLTQIEIPKSLRDGAITTSEADELTGKIDSCSKFAGYANGHLVTKQGRVRINHILK